MKYFVLGAMASGFLLYGMSMMYGATGTLDINEVAQAIASGRIKHQVLVFGLVFVVAGPGVQAGRRAFPHVDPDVYQGAPTAVTLLIGAAPKLAAFAIFIRLLVEGMLPLAIDWQQMLMLLADRLRCWWATWPPSRRPTSSACWPSRPSRRWALSCWA
jgi:NADH-quinone oxidoreductase subunit N